ncbi:hypothetical protein [Ectobacillus ponti]|uniref:Uncharacterized protein n=1 Tax=Ectobacillus ponti TaxID=2961894 RepID=A0AA41X2W5_9BACI|nr:hypothetical protein [Ectobacillus ponti]MCP8967941.1 hypothetical protein [Ectobacillus ponti]
MLEKVKAVFGQGVTAEIRLPKDTYELGETIVGDIVVKGAKRKAVLIEGAAVVFAPLGLDKDAKARLMPVKQRSFPVGAEEAMFVPFSYSIPADLDIKRDSAAYELTAKLMVDSRWEDYGSAQLQLTLPDNGEPQDHLPYEDPANIYLDELKARKPF